MSRESTISIYYPPESTLPEHQVGRVAIIEDGYGAVILTDVAGAPMQETLVNRKPMPFYPERLRVMTHLAVATARIQAQALHCNVRADVAS